MSEERTVKKVFEVTPEGKPGKSLLDDIENDLKKTGCRSWRKIAKNSDAWKLILKMARALHGQ
jgi:hypothetical protein